MTAIMLNTDVGLLRSWAGHMIGNMCCLLLPKVDQLMLQLHQLLQRYLLVLQVQLLPLELRILSSITAQAEGWHADSTSLEG